MADKKPGCSVKLVLEATDEDGRVISDIPQGGWYGMDRHMANVMVMHLNNAILNVVMKWNEGKFGEDWMSLKPPAPPAKR